MNIFILPSKNKNNKYIDLLINSLEANNSNLTVCKSNKDSIWSVFKIIVSGKVNKSKNILHVQWSTILYGSKFFLKSLFFVTVNTILILLLKTFFNTKVVWTVHNFFAHDYPHPKMDKFGRKCLFTISDLIIVQQKITFDDYKSRYSNKNIEYIPHGNYIDVYGKLKERDIELRKSFGFNEKDIVILSLGAVAPYKRNEEIIKAVTKSRENNPNLKLLIIGKGKEEYLDELKTISNDNGIVIKNMFVPDDEIPSYFSISDYSIFYYDNSEMTSGGIPLSLSYGLPAITRNIPGSEIVTLNTGYVFNNYEELCSILYKIPAKFENGSSSDIIDSVREYDWNLIAKKLINQYKTI